MQSFYNGLLFTFSTSDIIYFSSLLKIMHFLIHHFLNLVYLKIVVEHYFDFLITFCLEIIKLLIHISYNIVPLRFYFRF
jgi:hypothetical protein